MSICIRCRRQYSEPADEQGDHDCPHCGMTPEQRCNAWGGGVAKVEAAWSIELNCECPKCGRDVDLIEADDFWIEGPEPLEYDTKRTRELLVYCPECGAEFEVNCVY